MQVRPYYSKGSASTAFYDLVTSADKSVAGDVELYAALALEGGSVLELGAGTGRVSLELAKRGYDVTGLDLSQPMLDMAEKNRPAGVRLQYVQGDMRSFDLGRTFDAVISPFFSLAHLAPEPGWSETLAVVAKHLRPGGKAAFHMPIEEQMASPAPPKGSPVFRQGPLTLLMDSKTYDPAERRMDLDLAYVRFGLTTVERLTLFTGDLDCYAKAAGLVRDRPPVPLGDSGLVHIYQL